MGLFVLFTSHSLIGYYIYTISACVSYVFTYFNWSYVSPSVAWLCGGLISQNKWKHLCGCLHREQMSNTKWCQGFFLFVWYRQKKKSHHFYVQLLFCSLIWMKKCSCVKETSATSGNNCSISYVSLCQEIYFICGRKCFSADFVTTNTEPKDKCFLLNHAQMGFKYMFCSPVSQSYIFYFVKIHVVVIAFAETQSSGDYLTQS